MAIILGGSNLLAACIASFRSTYGFLPVGKAGRSAKDMALTLRAADLTAELPVKAKTPVGRLPRLSAMAASLTDRSRRPTGPLVHRRSQILPAHGRLFGGWVCD